MKALVTFMTVLAVAVPCSAACDTKVVVKASHGRVQAGVQVRSACDVVRNLGRVVTTERYCTAPTIKVVKEVVQQTVRIGNDRVSVSITRPVVRYRTVVEQRCVERTVVSDRVDRCDVRQVRTVRAAPRREANRPRVQITQRSHRDRPSVTISTGANRGRSLVSRISRGSSRLRLRIGR